MTPEDPLLQVWTDFKKQMGKVRRMGFTKPLIAWWDVSERATLNVKTWEQAGRHILSAASTGDETAINIIKTRRLIMDLLEQLKREREAKTAEGLPLGATRRGEQRKRGAGGSRGRRRHTRQAGEEDGQRSHSAMKPPGIALMPPVWLPQNHVCCSVLRCPLLCQLGPVRPHPAALRHRLAPARGSATVTV